MKYIGVDYGSKRIGLAVSDAGGTLAFPYKILPNEGNVVAELAVILGEEEVGGIVIGVSLDASGVANKIQKDIEEFTLELKTLTEIPIFFEKEFMTSHHATPGVGKSALHARQTKMKKVEHVDASAAALILQRYLDRIR